MFLPKFQSIGKHCKPAIEVEILFFAFSLVLSLASCSPRGPLIPDLADTPQPTSAQTAIPQTSTAISQSIDIKDGGFSLSVQPDLEFDTDASSISISDQRGGLIISLNGRPYVESSYTLQSFLGKYLAEMTARGGSFHQSDPYEITIDDKSGIAIDFTGSFLDQPITGKAVAVSPGEDFIVFGLGMSLQNASPEGWADSGSLIFETILDSIRFKEELK